MTWNHRVIKTESEWGAFYQIYEVYYTKEGEPCACTEGAMSPCGESVEELEYDCRLFVKASQQPVLNTEDFEEGGKYWNNKLHEDEEDNKT